MHASLLYQLTGDPAGGQIESQLGDGFPAIDAETVHYLDGQTLQHGTAAARIDEDRRVPVVRDHKIATVTDDVTKRAQTEYYLDLDAGWVGIDSADGEFFLELVERQQSVVAEELELALDVWIEDFSQFDGAGVWGVNYSEGEDDAPIRAGSGFHQDASLSGVKRDAEHISGVGFRYQWADHWIKGSIFESGYVALFEDTTAEFYGRWLADHVLPYAAYNADQLSATTQSRFTSTDDTTESATAEGRR
jgi:hypothetical protein